MKRCDEVMTKDPICCLADDVVAKAAQIMKDRDIGSVPVIENEHSRKLVGIVTDRDLALQVVAYGYDPKTTKVAYVMSHGVVTCRAEDNLQEALDLMSDYQLRRIPVVDNHDQIIGIIAQADVALRGNQPEKTAMTVKEISQSSMLLLER